MNRKTFIPQIEFYDLQRLFKDLVRRDYVLLQVITNILMNILGHS